MNGMTALWRRIRLTDILLSIDPKFGERILSGQKKIEFRRKLWSSKYFEKASIHYKSKLFKDHHIISSFEEKRIQNIYLYFSSPVCEIKARFTPGKITFANLEDLWQIKKDLAGISREEFDSYFKGKDLGFAIEITNLEIFNPAYKLNRRGPQWFSYFNKKDLVVVKNECF